MTKFAGFLTTLRFKAPGHHASGEHDKLNNLHSVILLHDESYPSSSILSEAIQQVNHLSGTSPDGFYGVGLMHEICETGDGC